VDLITVAWSPLLTAVKDHFLTRPIMLDVTVAILAMEIFLHGSFHTLNAMMLEIRESDDMAQH
jgi:hypothetical protein